VAAARNSSVLLAGSGYVRVVMRLRLTTNRRAPALTPMKCQNSWKPK
jgi:hypothetical protein